VALKLVRLAELWSDHITRNEAHGDTRSSIVASSFSGLLTRVLTGHLTISSLGYGSPVREWVREFREYLRAYRAYVSANLGWGRAVMAAFLWLAAMFAPLGLRAIVELPTWIAIAWMVGCALLSYVVAPFGMWRHQRAQIESSSRPDEK